MIHRLGIGVWVGLLLVSQGWAQRTISWQELHQIAEGCVRSHVGALPIEIEWIGDGPRQLTVSRDVTELRCMSDSSLVAQGRFVIEAWTHGQWAGRFVLSGKVWVTASELRLCKPIRAGQMLTMADVESSPRRMRLSEYWQRLRAEEVGKVRVRRDLPAGAPVFREDCLLYSA
ncbi:MAG: hypothetical protein NZ949_05945, partial [Candidatus Kapabacteria bacterium]|nr:hypothetical protein [Candidatus Kapabacteria bacterium]MDW7996757.1 hypothetical protein [Bacteroidota bacterium]